MWNDLTKVSDECSCRPVIVKCPWDECYASDRWKNWCCVRTWKWSLTAGCVSGMMREQVPRSPGRLLKHQLLRPTDPQRLWVCNDAPRFDIPANSQLFKVSVMKIYLKTMSHNLNSFSLFPYTPLGRPINQHGVGGGITLGEFGLLLQFGWCGVISYCRWDIKVLSVVGLQFFGNWWRDFCNHV